MDAVISTTRGSAAQKVSPALVVSSAEEYAPMPKKAPCPSEICPAYPTMTLRPQATMAYIAMKFRMVML